jgi:hypothetical protein
MKFLASGWHYWKKTFFFKIAASSAGETPLSDWYPQPFLPPALIIDSTIEQKKIFCRRFLAGRIDDQRPSADCDCHLLDHAHNFASPSERKQSNNAHI